MIAAVRSEAVKLATSRAVRGGAAATLVVALGYAALFGLTRRPVGDVPAFADNWMAIGGIVGGQGVPALGAMILMVVAALAVTDEYRTGLIEVTLAVTPRRSVVLAAKVLVNGIAAALWSVLLVLAAEYVFAAAARGATGELGVAGDLKPLLVVPAIVGLSVMIAVSLGALLRGGALTLAVILVWAGGVENVSLFAGEELSAALRRVLLFSNAQNAASNGLGALAGHSAAWSLAVIALWAAALFALGAIAFRQREA